MYTAFPWCLLADFYREKSEQLESQLEGEQKKRQDAEHHAQKRGEKLNSLDLQLKAQEKKYKDELKTMAQTVNNLKHELESKGNTIAYLTSQVHLLRKAAQAVGEDTRLPSSSLEDRDSVKYSPVPPKDGAPRHRRLLSNTSRTSSDHGLLTTFVRHRAASGRKMADSEFELDENVPDPTPFLRSQSQAGDSQIRRTERKPLPPIGLGSIDGTTGQGIVQPPPPQQTHSYAFVHKHRHRGQRGQSSSPEVEVESLAVDQADELRRAQEFKSTSTDCNWQQLSCDRVLKLQLQPTALVMWQSSQVLYTCLSMNNLWLNHYRSRSCAQSVADLVTVIVMHCWNLLGFWFWRNVIK